MDELQASLDQYEVQLGQVVQALAAEPDNEDLLQLKQDLDQLIMLSTESLLEQKRQFLLQQKEEKQDRSRYYFGYPYGRQPENEDDPDQFRVDADVENNFLLLWANDVEIDEVTNLLVKLGEMQGEAFVAILCESGRHLEAVGKSLGWNSKAQTLDW